MKQTQPTVLYIVLIIAMATWGLSWTNGKILGNYTTVPILMVWRFFIAALAMLLVLIFTKTPWRINRMGGVIILVSAMLLVLYNHFYFTGTHYGAAGAGGVLVTTLNPVLTFMLISGMNRELPQGRALAGIILGILGGSILINLWQAGWTAIWSSGNQYFVLCAISWAFLAVISARINKHMSTLTFSFWLYLASGFMALLFVGDGDLLAVLSYEFNFWLNLFSVSVGAMAFATTAYFFATSRLGA
ncbi:MAG: DMT family transporter [Candidatus Marinimicrobia bacterium]|nr:DMT family transporter [Candidatus Neomarinimicrobiota bacterium]